MIFEDEHAAEAHQLGFVLHLGDFIYEIVGIRRTGRRECMTARARPAALPRRPEDRDFHVPTTLEGYRTVYSGVSA